jgi:hypothetical protein
MSVLAGVGLYFLAGFLLGLLSIVFNRVLFNIGWTSYIDEDEDIKIAVGILIAWPVILPLVVVAKLFLLISRLAEKVLK